MENDDQVDRPAKVRQKRRDHLVEALASLRTREKSDVCLVAGEQKLFAHRLVLEASSPFFVNLLAEAEHVHKRATSSFFGKSYVATDYDQVTVEDVEPHTLEIILDYLYLGEIDRLNKVSEIGKVMGEALRMDLPDLYECCAAILIEVLDATNFVDIWEIAVQFQHSNLLKMTHFYLLNNESELTTTEKFMQSTVEQIKDLMEFTADRVPCFDRMFLVMVNWIRHNLKKREPHANGLFALVNPKLLSRQFYKVMLEDEELMNCSKELFNCMNELGIKVFVFSSHVYSADDGRFKNLPASVHCKNIKINFFCEQKVEEIYEITTNKVIKRVKPLCVMQQFDLHSMTWLQPRKICFNGFKGASLLQYDRHIYFIGGALDSVYGIFDVENNSIEYVECNIFNGRTDSGLCIHKNSLYLIGGHTNGAPLNTCFRLSPDSGQWTEVAKLMYGRTNPNVLSTTDYIYVIGSGLPTEKSARVIEYLRENMGEIERGIINVRNVPRNVSIYFTVSGNVLYGFYVYNFDLIRIWYNHANDSWNVKSFPMGPPVVTTWNGIAPTVGGKSLLFVSATPKGGRIPTHVWEPDSGVWTKLALPQGRPDLPDIDQLQFVYSSGI